MATRPRRDVTRVLLPAKAGKAHAGNTNVETKWRPEYVDIAHNLKLLGLPDTKIAKALGVSETTFSAWKLKHEELREALLKGGAISDGEVVRSLYELATGRARVRRNHVTQFMGDVTITEVEDQLPPSTTAGIFLLSRRHPGKWGSKPEDAGKTPHDNAEQARLFLAQMQQVDNGQAVVAQKGEDDE